ncbi:disease resistance protein RGA5-like [Phragmites australis]|uniref:disease resistance protein RGA5-like n=1 Tax=Phragmites australis TaxID=29695 RepID=UPI002D76A8BB|nr:disease resistance protein RGA5-like [Phragmites australis]
MEAAIVVSVSMGVVNPVLEKLTVLMGDKYKKIKGLEEKVSSLKRELSYMNSVLEKMEQDADKLDQQDKIWRKDVIEMSYDIEDYIDDFIHHFGEDGDKVGMGILQKAYRYLRTFKDRHRLVNQFQEIENQVMQVSKRRKRYKLDQCISITTPVIVDPRLSAFYKESASLVGIDTQKEELVKWVMDEGQQLKVVSIVGFGGLGKTTLANEVYREVSGKFDCKAFVSISQKPDMRMILNSVLKQLGLQTYSYACGEKDLIDDLCGHLQEKRYFIVVDDLWDIQAWNTIGCVFLKNNLRSRVMITTRDEDVARACYDNHGCIHNMRRLSEQDSRKLFFNRIFGSEEDACPSQFEVVSCEILKKCGGLPLAIITVASILACHQNHKILKEHWEQHTKLKELWEYIQKCLATNEFEKESALKDMINILDLSYKYLPHHLKACFLYLGSYPEDHEISRVELVRRWVAEGFVSISKEWDVWDVAESYFNELVNRSMIQPVYEDHFGIEELVGCRVHDMMLDLIRSKCEEYNFVSVVHGLQAMGKVQDNVRRLSVDLSGGEDATMPEPATGHLSKVRSLAISRGSKWKPPLVEFKFLRVLFLQLSFPEQETARDLTAISQLSHVKYLKIEGMYNGYEDSVMLPAKISGLRQLQTLEIIDIPVSNIPSDIVDLPCLSHLDLTSHENPCLPDGIGKMKWLRTLSCLSLRKSTPENIKGISELTNLAELNLNCKREESGCVPTATWMAALSSSLEKLSNLKCLLLWSSRNAFCADAMSSFSPPFRNIEKLYLRALTLPRVPRWISDLRSLRALDLGVKEITCEDVVGIIGTLPVLARLHLRIPGVPAERIVIGSTVFTVLKWFGFDCDGASCITFEAGAMPNLRNFLLRINPREWDNATPVGLEHLSSLKEIYVVSVLSGNRDSISEADPEPLLKVFQEAADALPSRPAFGSHRSWIRPEEEE